MYFYNASKKPVAVFDKNLTNITKKAEKEGETIIIRNNIGVGIRTINKLK